MKPCPVIQDLLPLYVDDAVSPESRQMVDTHLQDCPDCRRALQALQGAPTLPAATAPPAPSDEARFLGRLKRQAGTAVGLILTLLVVTALGSVQYGKWSRDRAYRQQLQAEHQSRSLAVERLAALSPDPDLLLRENGITWSGQARRNGDRILLDWVMTIDLDQGVERVIPPNHHGPEVWVLDQETGQTLQRGGGSGSASWSRGQGSGAQELRFSDSGPVRLAISYPALMAYKPLAEPFRTDFQRPEGDGEILLDQRVTHAGIEFVVDLVRFAGNRVTVEYRQLTDPTKVGYHFLPLQLSDRLGFNQGGLGMDQLPDPLTPTAEFTFVNSPSRNWRLSLSHVALAIPARFETDVK